MKKSYKILIGLIILTRLSNAQDVTITQTPPVLNFIDPSGGTDLKHWDFYTSGNLLYARTINDADNAANNWLMVVRNGFMPTSVSFPNGLVGIGTPSPQTTLHIVSYGTSSNATSEYSGDLIIQGNPGNRTSTTGASLEFNIPANTDGSNPWGQARIIAVAGNGNSSDATGKLILGTRRMFDKGVGTGTTWNYGDDLVIDGGGNIGINTGDTKGYKFAVNGTAIATSMTVKLNANWPDYVFKPDYKLMTLNELKNFVNSYSHLPGFPSEKDINANGLNLGETDKLLTKKVEELTLYLIDKDKQLNDEKEQINIQQKQIDSEQQVNSEQAKQLRLQQEQINLLIKQVSKLSKDKSQ